MISWVPLISSGTSSAVDLYRVVMTDHGRSFRPRKYSFEGIRYMQGILNLKAGREQFETVP